MVSSAVCMIDETEYVLNFENETDRDTFVTTLKERSPGDHVDGKWIDVVEFSGYVDKKKNLVKDLEDDRERAFRSFSRRRDRMYQNKAKSFELDTTKVSSITVF